MAEVKNIEKRFTGKAELEAPERPPKGAPEGVPVDSRAQEEKREETREPSGEEKREPDGEEKREPAEDLVCRKCGGPVGKMASGTYRCLNTGRVTSVVPPREYKEEGEGSTPPGGGQEKGQVRGIIGEPPSPNSILKRILSLDPVLSPEQVAWIMDNVEVYGVLSTNDLSSLIQELNVKSPTKTAMRIANRYAAALQHELNRDPSLQQEPDWSALLYKQSGYQPPQYPRQNPTVSPVPMQNPDPRYQQLQPNPYHSSAPMVLVPSQGNPSLQAVPQNQPAIGPQGGDGRYMTREDLDKYFDERDKREAERKEKAAIKQTMEGTLKALDNLNQRVVIIEQNGVPKKPGDQEGPFWNETIRNAMTDNISKLLRGEGITEEKVKSIVSQSIPQTTTPPGTRNEFDMQVEKSQHEANARMREAEEKRLGYETLADGIRDAAQSLGWNIGAGISGSSTEQREPRRPTRAKGSGVKAEPQPIRLGKDGLLHTRCPYDDCHKPISFEEGKSTIKCGGCNRVIRVQATEEELGRKPKEEKPPEKPEEKPPKKPEEKKPEETGKPGKTPPKEDKPK